MTRSQNVGRRPHPCPASSGLGRSRLCLLTACVAGWPLGLAAAQPSEPAQDEPPASADTEPASTQPNGQPVGRLAPPAAGIDDPGPTLTPPVERRGPPPVTLQLSANHLFDADWDDDRNGGISTTRVAQEVMFRRPIAPDGRVSLALGLSAEQTLYDIDGNPELVPGSTERPLEDVYRFALMPGFQVRQTERFSWGAGAVLAYAGEPDVSLEDGFVWGVSLSGFYDVSDRLRVGGLLLVIDQVGADDGLVFPVPIIRWQIDDRFSVGTDATLVSRGVYLSYEPRKWLEFRGSYGVARHSYRLNDEGPAAVHNGVVIDRGQVVTVSAALRPTKRLELRGRVGVVFDRELEFENAQGREISDPGTEAAVLLGLDINWAFR